MDLRVVEVQDLYPMTSNVGGNISFLCPYLIKLEEDSNMIDDKIKTIVCKTLSIPETTYNLELSAGDIPAWDSIGHVTLLQAVEESFNIAFDVEDAIDIESVEDLIDTVKRYVDTSTMACTA